MPKYKISKSNLKEFFGFFGKKNKPKDIQKLIDNDPQLKKIDKELAAINSRAKIDPEYRAIRKKYGLI